ncbi:MAG: PAS domain S-box protein [Deltaproteobacteria bacterium]|nr:PAS domain S-box protein [Deltaproteobacteria bacterium]
MATNPTKQTDRALLSEKWEARAALETDHYEELLLFNEIATITAQALSVQEVLDLILNRVLQFLGVSAGILLLWDQPGGRLSHAASQGFPNHYLVKINESHIEKVIGPYLMHATQPLIIHDAANDPRLQTSTFSDFIRKEPRFQAMVSIPLRYRERMIGFLNLADETPALFSYSRKKFFGILGNQIGLAIDNARLSNELRRSERRYRRIFEGSKDMIFVTDQEGRLLDINPAGVELLAFPSKYQALRLGNLSAIFENPRDWEKFQRQAEYGGFVRDLEVTLLRRDEARIHVLLTGIVRRKRDGQITGYEGIVKDITERKRIEQEILKEKKTTEGILEGMPVPTFVINRDHQIIYWNRACEELTGYKRQELLGSYRLWLPFALHERSSMANLVVEQNIEALRRFYGDKNLKKSPNLPGAYEAYERFENLRRPQERYLYSTASPIYDEQGQIQGAVQSILDMTDREKLAQYLKESEEKYRCLVETSLDGIALHAHKKLLYANKACLEMFGYSYLEELQGVDFLGLIAPAYHQVILRRLPGISRRKGPPRIFELKGIKKDGTEFDIEVISFPTSFGGQSALQTHIRDITEKKRLEEQLIRSEKMVALGQLAAGVAHEINNPLGGILVFGHLLLEDLGPDRPERANVEKIIREATRCQEIIKGLLDFSRQLPSKMVLTDINSVLEEVLSLVENHLLFNNVKVNRQFNSNLPPLKADKSKLEQVFINLFINAAEAVKGEGTLNVSTNLIHHSDIIEIRISDDGPGIPEAYLNRLFDPFFTTKEVGRGVGLGLSISYGIIRKHLGRIYVDTSVTPGTTFVIELPAHKPGRLSLD